VLEHRAALDQLCPARHAQAIDDPRLCVMPITDCRLLLVQGNAEDPILRERIHRVLGLALPAPLKASVRLGTAILWLGPKEWLIETTVPASATVQLWRAGADPGAEASGLHAITDQSDAFAGFDLSGPRAVDVLMSGCSLDLAPRAFPVGHAARTAIADVPAIIWSPMAAAPTSSPSGHFRCWLDRSFAAHFWDWLAESPSRW